jgi:type VI secretion system protein ImpC
MPQRDSFAQVHVDVRTGAPFTAAPADDAPFCLAVLGDFGGREGTGRPAAVSGPLLVDRDDLDAVLARVAPEVALDLGGPQRLRFTALDDFHPDRIHDRLPLLATLGETRRRLADPGTFADAAAALQAPPPPAADGGRRSATVERLATGSLLDDILAAAPEPTPAAAAGGPGSGASAAGELAGFLRDVVRPHLVPRPDPRQQELLASVDAAAAALLRLVLHHPAVRALERRWRGVELLVRRLETGPSLRVALFDVTRAELAAGLGREPRDGALARRLAAGAAALPQSAGWTALVGLYDLGGEPADVALLDGLAQLGEACGAPWLGAAPRALLPALDADETDDADEAKDADEATNLTMAAGAGATAQLWTAVRRAPYARWLGLAHPAVLLRLPYGADGEPVDALDFEELEPGLDAPAARARLLWGDAALVPALVLGAAFAADGWQLRPGAHLEVDRLPLHLLRHAGGVEAVPPNGQPLGERDALRLLEAGVMPLLARREGDSVRLARLQSVAEPVAALAGRWTAAPT